MFSRLSNQASTPTPTPTHTSTNPSANNGQTEGAGSAATSPVSPRLNADAGLPAARRNSLRQGSSDQPTQRPRSASPIPGQASAASSSAPASQAQQAAADRARATARMDAARARATARMNTLQNAAGSVFASSSSADVTTEAAVQENSVASSRAQDLVEQGDIGTPEDARKNLKALFSPLSEKHEYLDLQEALATHHESGAINSQTYKMYVDELCAIYSRLPDPASDSAGQRRSIADPYNALAAMQHLPMTFEQFQQAHFDRADRAIRDRFDQASQAHNSMIRGAID